MNEYDVAKAEFEKLFERLKGICSMDNGACSNCLREAIVEAMAVERAACAEIAHGADTASGEAIRRAIIGRGGR